MLHSIHFGNRWVKSINPSITPSLNQDRVMGALAKRGRPKSSFLRRSLASQETFSLPAFPGSFPGGTCPLAPLDVEEQKLYSELPPDDGLSHHVYFLASVETDWRGAVFLQRKGSPLAKTDEVEILTIRHSQRRAYACDWSTVALISSQWCVWALNALYGEDSLSNMFLCRFWDKGGVEKQQNRQLYLFTCIFRVFNELHF